MGSSEAEHTGEVWAGGVAELKDAELGLWTVHRGAEVGGG